MSNSLTSELRGERFGAICNITQSKSVINSAKKLMLHRKVSSTCYIIPLNYLTMHKLAAANKKRQHASCNIADY
jgi:hypothetical protein